jgi:hypothetical protein
MVAQPTPPFSETEAKQSAELQKMPLLVAEEANDIALDSYVYGC